MNITSLVTGGAGFIGSHVVNHLLQKGHQVVVLDDLSGGRKENVNPKAILYVGSVTDTDLINKLFNKYFFTYIYHLAAYAAEGLSHFIRKFNYENNLIGSINLINASVNHSIKCFVFTSSIAVYGENILPLVETANPQPVDPYGIAKHAVELDLLNAHKMFGLDYIIFRPHNVYGVNQNISDPYRNVIGIFLNQILQNQPLTIYGDGTQSRAFTFIDDVAPYIADSINIPSAYNQVFNIGSNQVLSIRELVDAVSKAMGSDLRIEDLPKRKEATHSYADHTKFESIFKPRRYTELEKGLLEMAEWAKSLSLGSGKKISNIEIRKNLPDNWK